MRQRSDALDLDKLVRVPEHGNPEQAAGRAMWPGTRGDDIPNSGQVGASPYDVDRRLHKVRRPGTTVAQNG